LHNTTTTTTTTTMRATIKLVKIHSEKVGFMSFKVQMQMMGIFGLMPHQMGTLEPSWGR